MKKHLPKYIIYVFAYNIYLSKLFPTLVETTNNIYIEHVYTFIVQVTEKVTRGR